MKHLVKRQQLIREASMAVVETLQLMQAIAP